MGSIPVTVNSFLVEEKEKGKRKKEKFINSLIHSKMTAVVESSFEKFVRLLANLL